MGRMDWAGLEWVSPGGLRYRATYRDKDSDHHENFWALHNDHHSLGHCYHASYHHPSYPQGYLCVLA